jgi:hypothetical protein
MNRNIQARTERYVAVFAALIALLALSGRIEATVIERNTRDWQPLPAAPFSAQPVTSTSMMSLPTKVMSTTAMSTTALISETAPMTLATYAVATITSQKQLRPAELGRSPSQVLGLSLLPEAIKPTETDTPPYTSGGPSMAPSLGTTMMRSGPLSRVPGLVYSADPLASFRQDKTVVRPSTMPHILSNPHRLDGTALSAYYSWPHDFTGHIPVYTEGNWWPFVGKKQPQPPHSDLAADSGIFFRNGACVDPSLVADPLVVQGESGAFIVNKAKVSVLITSGSFPGNEQPGQVMAPVNPGETAVMPIPPTGWFPDASGRPRVPELYASVGGLDPLDAPGWHKTNSSPDYGTPGFCYTFGGRFTEMFGASWLFVGFNGNEGYDPPVSGDCMYGVALYMEDAGKHRELVAITDTDVRRQTLCAVARFNPQANAQHRLSAFPAIRRGGVFTYELLTHEDTKKLMTETDWCSGASLLTHSFA